MLKKKKRVMISKKFCLDISEELKCAENEKKKIKEACVIKKENHILNLWIKSKID